MAETAAQFMIDLESRRTEDGIRMGQIFALAKESTRMPLSEIQTLLRRPEHEARVGAVSIMDFLARAKTTTLEQHKALYDTYIQNHQYINTWDLVDRSAIYVVGGYLADKPREALYKLAKSSDMNQRRTAIVATFYFLMKQRDTTESLKLAELLVHEQQELTQKAVGWVLRTVGDVAPGDLRAFLDAHAAIMPRPMLRNAVEKLDKTTKAHYMGLRSAASAKK